MVFWALELLLSGAAEDGEFMMSRYMTLIMLFGGLQFTSLAQASYSPGEQEENALETSRLTSDAVKYDRLQEVKVQKDSKPDLETELESLAVLESQFANRISTPRARIEKRNYKRVSAVSKSSKAHKEKSALRQKPQSKKSVSKAI